MTESAASHVSQGNADGVSLRRVSKTYGLATVLQVDELTFANGEVTGLVGENGAGKSTMLGILAGTVTPDPGGEVVINGEPVHPGSPIASQAAGVAMVSQEFPLVGQLSVAENLTLGMRPEGARGFFYDRKSVAAAARRHAGSESGSTSTRAPRCPRCRSRPGSCSRWRRRSAASPRLLILDEPTSALGPIEADLVIRIAREHAANGGAVIFVGHRLEEVREAADRVVVLRNGRLVADMAVAEATDDRLIREMVGREHLASVTADHSGLGAAGAGVHRRGLTAAGLGPIEPERQRGRGARRRRASWARAGAASCTRSSARSRAPAATMTLAGAAYAPR